MNFTTFAKSVQRVVTKKSPEILVGMGIAGLITTTILAVRATPRALELLDARPYEDEKPTRAKRVWHLVRTTWYCYLPAAITGTVSIACIVGGNSQNLRKNAALATAYTLSESALREYQEKVIETIGEKKERVIRDTIAQERITKDPASKKEIFITEKGNTLCYDSISGRYFKSDADVIKRAENEINRLLLDANYVSLNEFYDKIGLRNVTMGDDLGWYVNDGYLELDFSSNLSDDNTPCLVLNYTVAPRYDYRDR